MTLIPRTDWSHETRKYLALLRAGSDPCQTKITSFYQVAEKVTKLTYENEEYHGIVLAAEEQQKEYCQCQSSVQSTA